MDPKQTLTAEPRPLGPRLRLALDIGLPFLYLLPLVVAWFSPKNFAFGFPALVPYLLALGFFGWLLVVMAMAQMGRALRVLPGAERLVVGGVYKYIRHPIYIGLVLNLLGLLAACGSTVGVVYVFVVVIPLNLVRARLEERALLRQFGESYQAHLDRTWF